MIPLGTGLFKTMYDTKKHNETLINLQEKRDKEKEMKNNYNKNGNMNFIKEYKLYGDRDNIIEEKLMRSSKINDKYQIKNKLEFNLIDLIN